MVEIRFATLEDISRIMDFLDEYWQKGHIMAVSREMFEFQHVEKDDVYYIIAEEVNTGKIYGTMGYIPMNHTNHPDVFTMMVKTLEGSGYDFLSEEMASFLRKKLNVRYHIGVGIRKKFALALEGLNGEQIGKWNQYYRLNDCDRYRICHITEKKISKVKYEEDYSIREIKGTEEFAEQLEKIDLEKMKPYRDRAYILHRYGEHPIFTYQVYGLLQKELLRGIIIAREVFSQNAKCLRIVDYYGDENELSHIGYLMDQLMKDKKYEYVDFCNYGIEERILTLAGFEIAGRDKNIVPHYFDPYEQKNIEIYFFSNHMDGVKIYKAFSDQDRPNTV